MDDLKIKEISTFIEDNINKTKMIISENNIDKEIILEGDGSIKTAVEV